MSGTKILADISPNPTLLVKYDANRGSWLDKPENLWAPCDWHSFMQGRILCKIVKTVKKQTYNCNTDFGSQILMY